MLPRLPSRLLLAMLVLLAAACPVQQPPGLLLLQVEEGAWAAGAQVDFGRVTQPGPATRALHLQNAGTTPLEVTALLARSGEAVALPEAPDATAPFSLELALPLWLAPGETRTVEARFHPERGSGALQQAEVALQVAGGSEAPLSFSALADVRPGLPGGLVLEPAKVDCGAVAPGGEARVPLVLRSELAVPIERLTFTSSHPEELSVLDGRGQPLEEASLPAGGALSLRVRCQPKTALWYGRALEVTASAPLSTTFRIPVARLSPSSGPVVELSPVDLLELGEVAVLDGQPVRTSQVVLRNAAWANEGYAQTVQLRLGQKQADGTWREPYVEVVPLSGTEEGEVTVALASPYSGARGLGMGESVAFTVTVAPRSEGVKEVELRFFTNDPRTPAKVLRVTARAVSLPDCALDVAPEAVEFGEVGATGGTVPVTLRNTGSTRCLLTNLALTPDSHAAFSVPSGGRESVVLGAGQTHRVVLRAQGPGAIRADITGTLRLGVSSRAAPVREVALHAVQTGAPCLVVVPADRDFGVVQKGCQSMPKGFSVYNACPTEQTVLGFQVLDGAGQPAGGPGCSGPASCPEFAIIQQPVIPAGGLVVRPGGAAVQFMVRYQPIDYSADIGTIAVHALADGQPTSLTVTVRGRGEAGPLHTDVFTQDSLPRVDVLHVLDTSPTMADDMERLQPFLQSYAESVASACMDVHIGVTTADLSATGARGQLLGDASNPPVLDSLSTTGLAEKLMAKFSQPLTSTTPAQPLAAAVKSLSESLASGANTGFRRPDASLSVVIFSDRAESSPLPVEDYVASLQGLGSSPALVSVSATTGLADATSCGAVPNERLISAVHLTNGLLDSICAPSPALEPIGKAATGCSIRTRYALSGWPDLTTNVLEVTLDGAPVPEFTSTGERVWRFESTSNSVVFEPAFAPGPGTTLAITYRGVCRVE